MAHPTLHKPLLPPHYFVWCDPPDEAGDETMHIVSERRSLKLKGQSFREFSKSVIPLLDGSRTLEEIEGATVSLFRPQDLRDCIQLLEEQGIVVEGEQASLSPKAAVRRRPQLNLFHDLAPNLDVQARLATARISVLGLGGAGGAAAMALAAAGVGSIQCLDGLRIAPSDTYLCPPLAGHEGADRAETVASLIRQSAPEVDVTTSATALATESDLRDVLAGAQYVVCSLDASQANLIYKLNKVCLASGTPWITCAPAGAEISIGPAFQPAAGPCYMCYRMRLVACAGNPEDAFAFERLLDRRHRDDSAQRESLVFSTGIAANIVGWEVVKSLTGIAEPSLIGRVLTLRLTDLAIERHTVLRKPWCPVCGTAVEPRDGR